MQNKNNQRGINPKNIRSMNFKNAQNIKINKSKDEFFNIGTFNGNDSVYLSSSKFKNECSSVTNKNSIKDKINFNNEMLSLKYKSNKFTVTNSLPKNKDLYSILSPKTKKELISLNLIKSHDLNKSNIYQNLNTSEKHSGNNSVSGRVITSSSVASNGNKKDFIPITSTKNELKLSKYHKSFEENENDYLLSDDAKYNSKEMKLHKNSNFINDIPTNITKYANYLNYNTPKTSNIVKSLKSQLKEIHNERKKVINNKINYSIGSLNYSSENVNYDIENYKKKLLYKTQNNDQINIKNHSILTDSFKDDKKNYINGSNGYTDNKSNDYDKKLMSREKTINDEIYIKETDLQNSFLLSKDNLEISMLFNKLNTSSDIINTVKNKNCQLVINNKIKNNENTYDSSSINNTEINSSENIPDFIYFKDNRYLEMLEKYQKIKDKNIFYETEEVNYKLTIDILKSYIKLQENDILDREKCKSNKRKIIDHEVLINKFQNEKAIILEQNNQLKMYILKILHNINIYEIEESKRYCSIYKFISELIKENEYLRNISENIIDHKFGLNTNNESTFESDKSIFLRQLNKRQETKLNLNSTSYELKNVNALNNSVSHIKKDASNNFDNSDILKQNFKKNTVKIAISSIQNKMQKNDNEKKSKIYYINNKK